MGLDGVELLMAIEEDFELAIPDGDAEKLCTPNDIADYLMQRLGSPTDTKPYSCLSQRQFYQLRRALMQEFGITRRQIRRQTPLHRLLPHPRTQWRQLSKAVDGSLPWLECAGPAKWLLNSVPLLTTALLLHAGIPPGWTAALALLCWGMAWIFIGPRLADRIPMTATVGSITSYVALPDRKNWSRQEILQRVMVITSEQLSIKLEQIRPEHRFVEDLGVD